MRLFQVHSLAKTRERSAFITNLPVERGEGSLILSGDRRVPGSAAPLGFAVGRDRLLEFPLGDAAHGKQAHKRRASPKGSPGKRSQGSFDPDRVAVAQGLAVLLEQANQLVPVIGLPCQIDRVEGIGIRPGTKRVRRPAAQIPQPRSPSSNQS